MKMKLLLLTFLVTLIINPISCQDEDVEPDEEAEQCYEFENPENDPNFDPVTANEEPMSGEELLERLKREDDDVQGKNVQVEKDVTINGNNYQYNMGPNAYNNPRPQAYGYRPRPTYGQGYGYRPRPGANYNQPQYRPKRQCVSTGMACTNGSVCCTNVCEAMPAMNQPRRCCLSEGLICDNSAPGNGGLLPCCNGLFCDQLAAIPQVTVCQERLYRFENQAGK